MSVDLGLVSVIGADAVGRPGQRRFRLFARSNLGSAIMWMEKEHLNSLSLALDQFLAMATGGQVLRTEARVGEKPPVEGMPADFPVDTGHEFQVGQMQLNYDELEEHFILNVTPVEIIVEPGIEPLVRMREEDMVTFAFTREDAQELSSTIAEVVAAGRPVCPFCGAPLDGGPHACEKQNGHRTILQIEEEEDEDE